MCSVAGSAGFKTGGRMTLAYSSMRGYGAIHPCLAELKVGQVDLIISHPLQQEEEITVGAVMITDGAYG